MWKQVKTITGVHAGVAKSSPIVMDLIKGVDLNPLPLLQRQAEKLIFVGASIARSHLTVMVRIKHLIN
jgi:hypothetical protein